jgi:hypothetical protein
MRPAERQEAPESEVGINRTLETFRRCSTGLSELSHHHAENAFLKAWSAGDWILGGGGLPPTRTSGQPRKRRATGSGEFLKIDAKGFDLRLELRQSLHLKVELLIDLLDLPFNDGEDFHAVDSRRRSARTRLAGCAARTFRAGLTRGASGACRSGWPLDTSFTARSWRLARHPRHAPSSLRQRSAASGRSTSAIMPTRL